VSKEIRQQLATAANLSVDPGPLALVHAVETGVAPSWHPKRY